MYRKYYEVWSTHAALYGPRTALLYQVGGFFELYDTENLANGTTAANIREIAELCQLSLTTHVIDEATQTLFGGFPEHALGKFERILVQAGFTVVVVVQRKGKNGAVEDRIVDHIASPGCYVDSVGIKERRLVGCVLESLSGGSALRRVYWAVAALDIATGRIWFAEGSGSADRLHQFLCIHPPAELVIWSDGHPAANAISTPLQALCTATHLRCLGSASVALEEAALESLWAPARKRLPWISQQPQARRCLAALMTFASEHMPSALRALDLPEAWVPDGEVRLGNAALEQLGLVSLRDEKQSLLGLMDTCRSVAGRRLLRSRLMRPITDTTGLEARLDRIAAAGSEVKAAVTERGLRSLYDMSRLWRRLELGTATMNDMACLLRSLEAVKALLEAWPEMAAPTHAGSYLEWVLGTWNVTATVALARDGNGAPVTALPWTAGVYEEAEAMFAKGLAIRQQAADLCTAWSATGKAKAEPLYLDDAEGGGFRITGTKRRVSAAVAALRDEGDTTARMTPYKTSALIETATLDTLSSSHRSWMGAWAPVWLSTWDTAIATLVSRGAGIQAALEAWCAELDVSWSVARLAAEWKWCRPTFETGVESFVDVTGLRHPILERIQTGVPYVAHSITLTPECESTIGSKRGVLLYGMNASGKSSLMKALGLATLLAQCGFPVPATSMRLSPFTAIFTRILGNDNLWAGLSSFAVEMTEFREILRFADERSLVLGDELCSGTESLSATALVAAGVEVLADRGTKFVFATHLHELATLPDIAGHSGVRAYHLKVHYEAATDRLIYDRTLAEGSGSALYGLEVCRALDLPSGYLERATALRKALAGDATPQQTRYTTDAVKIACEVCGSAKGLEAHHIHPQAEAATATHLHSNGNLVTLCTSCHDDHHGGRLTIIRWEDTSAGRRLLWSRSVNEGPKEEVVAWVREQRSLKIRVSTIQRMAKQIFGIDLTEKWIRGCG
jgi:DNA mismatch repair protein MutS